MFTPEERDRLRAQILDRAAADGRICSAAITGSAALEREDRWSDIDLAFAIADPAELPAAVTNWISWMYGQQGALHHVEVRRGAWSYQVFFLANTLQVDLAFVPADDFRPLAPSFRLVFGRALEEETIPGLSGAEVIGFGWLYALHARSSIARGRNWQAEYMISAVRDHALALACMRYGLPSSYGKGMDLLPQELTKGLAGALVRELCTAELWRAFGVAVQGLMSEIESADAALASRLRVALLSLADGGRP